MNCTKCKSEVKIPHVRVYDYNFTTKKFEREERLCDKCQDADMKDRCAKQQIVYQELMKAQKYQNDVQALDRLKSIMTHKEWLEFHKRI